MEAFRASNAPPPCEECGAPSKRPVTVEQPARRFRLDDEYDAAAWRPTPPHIFCSEVCRDRWTRRAG